MDVRILACYVHVMMCINLVGGKSSNTTAAHELWEELFVTRGYNFNIRPVVNPDNITNVTVAFHLKSINHLDEVSEILKVSAYMFIEWYDEFLTWNSSDFGNITLTRWSQNDVWLPDVTLYNSVNSYNALGHKTILVENFEDGYISWAPMELFEASCPVDMTYYPFDIQTCELQFMSWSYTDDAVTLDAEFDTVQLDSYSSNPQWEILSTSATVGNNSAGSPVDLVTFSIRMQRKPQHHLLTLFLPVVLLAVLDIFVFALPSDGGERSGYAVTVFLAFAVFLTIVDNTMPANSEKVSLFSVYVVIQSAQSTLITVLSLLLIRCASLDDNTPVPCVFTALVRISRCSCRNNTTKANQIGSEEKDVDVRSIVTEHGSSSASDSKGTETYSWKLVADAADRIFFVVFSTIFVLTTAICFSVLALAPN